MDLKPYKSNIYGLKGQQVKALEFLKNFMASDELEAIIKGYAGTGKTHLLKPFINKVVRVNFCPTAPTHKAVRVIEKNLNRKGKTLQALHGLRPNTDITNFNIARPQFDPNGIEYIKNYGLVIIDEASQINSGIFDLNKQRAKLYKTKILYIGDEAQLPPVKEKISKCFLIKNSFKLTEIIRQEAGHPLLELFSHIRNDIKSDGLGNDFLRYILTERESLKGQIGYKLTQEFQFKKDIKELFDSTEFEKDVEYVRHLSWTNASVAKWNRFIRNSLFNNPKKVLIKDDLLTAYNTFLNEFNEPVIINSEDYIIDAIREYVNNYKIKTFAVNLISLHNARNTSVLQIIDHTDKDSFKKYYQILNHLHYEALTATVSERKRKWSRFYQFKNNILCMVSFTLSKKNNEAMVKKDIDYGYAMTIHKSQGSTFKNVTIDLDDIIYHTTPFGKYPVRDVTLRNKLIYVAMSRATDKAMLKL